MRPQNERFIPENQSSERFRTDSAHEPCHILRIMNKKKNRIEIARKIISSVKREMQKPRLTESVRNGGREQAVPVVEEFLVRSERV
jgi:hypothetical protein